MVDLAKLVASAFPSDRKQFDSVIIISNSVKKIKEIYHVIPKDTEITILSSKSRVVESFDESDISVQLMDESLSAMGLQILTQLHDMVLQAIGEGRISRGERILVVLGDPIDGLFSIDTTMLSANRFASLANETGIDLEVLTKAMQLARHIGSRGREGHSVGALFAIGSLPKLRKFSTPLVLNPFKGHDAERKSILLDENHETMAEFAWLDGAIFFNKDGVASDAGRYIQVPAGTQPKYGEGGRHLAARAISHLAECAAICVSSSGTISLYVNGKERYKVRLS
ncbi:MAG: DNA integrity scanning protein DisA nucleotide-binding domain protein [Candidatus Poseidoniaceae archaeon]